MNFKLYILPLVLVLFGCIKPDNGVSKSDSNEIIWEVLSLPKTDQFRFFKSGIWDGKRFILLKASSSSLIFSRNGIEWSKLDIAADEAIDDIAFVNGVMFLKIGVWWSALDNTGKWKPLLEVETTKPIWNGQRYLFFSDSTKYSSVDTKDWQQEETIGLPDIPYEIIFEDNMYIAHVEYQKNFISKDGIKWTPFHPDSRNINITYFKGELYGSADNLPAVRVLQEGEWKTSFRPKIGPAPSDNGLTVIDNRLFAYGKHISWSNDGINWGSYVLPGFEDVEKIIAGGDKFIAIGTGNLLVVGASNMDRDKLIRESKKFNNLDDIFVEN